jgi:hypothetical protein
MRETCFCERSGELEDREPVLDALGQGATAAGGSARSRVGDPMRKNEGDA